MKRAWTIWFLCVLFPAGRALLADPEGFAPGNLFLDARGGIVFSRSGSVVRDLDRGQNDAFTGQKFGYTTFLRGNSDQINANIAANAAAPDLSLQSRNIGLGFEYGLSDLFGIGFSVLDERLNVRNIRSNLSSDQITLAALTLAFPSASSAAYNNALIQLELLDPTIRTNRLPYLHSTTANAVFRVHPFDGMIDPYAGVSLGFGREFQTPTFVWRPALNAGLRVLTQKFYTGIELEQSFLQLGRSGSLPIPPKAQFNQTQLFVYAGLRLD